MEFKGFTWKWKHRSRAILCGLLGVGLIFIPLSLTFSTFSQAAAVPTVKVLIEDQKSELTVFGTDLQLASLSEPAGRFQLARRQISLKCGLSGTISTSVDQKKTIRILGPLQVTSLAGFIKIGTSQYREELWIYAFNGQCYVVNQLDLEKYVSGLLNSEMNSKWSLETLKAQAVAARTYAVYQMRYANSSLSYRDIKPPFDLSATEADQVYQGAHQEKYRSIQATLQTRGEILTYDSKPVKAFYHSTCGGHTSSAKAVWGKTYSYMKPVRCSYCDRSPQFQWIYSVSQSFLEKTLALQGLVKGSLLAVYVKKKDPYGRAQQIAVQSTGGFKTVSGLQFRSAIGRSHLKSTEFDLISSNGRVVFRGAGSGHGVGMCQWGAKTMGDRGINYKKILSHYYPDLAISKIY